jgi:hypothetical protein
MTKDGWTCAGGPHPVALERIESFPVRGRDAIALERCRTCGTLYHHRSFEVNDWGANGDYYSETQIWRVLTPIEAQRLRADPAWQPDTEPAHRWDSGWRSG